jgi:hypothetical protein
MPERRCHPQFEPGPAGFVQVNQHNLLAALSDVLPAETINMVRAGLAAKDKAADYAPRHNYMERPAVGSEADAC